MDMLMSTQFWVAVGQIIMIDILLGGDNAVVIALACRKLPPKQRAQGILWGTAGAVVLRIGLIFFALQLLAIPLLKLFGAGLLLWIGVKLLIPDHGYGHAEIAAGHRLWSAVKTVIIADFVMSLDNVIAIAGAAEAAGGDHTMALVVFGILVSIPIIMWGSQFVIKLMDKLPIIITLGGMLLGWIAGTMAVTDPALLNPEVLPQLPKLPASDLLRYGAGLGGALLVLAMGKWLAARATRELPAVAAAAPHAVAGAVQRVLLAVDGSATALRAVQHVVALRNALREPGSMAVHLLNVQRPVSGDVASFVASKTLDEYHHERSDAALAPARALLAELGIGFTEHQRVGSPGVTIAQVAQELGCDLIVMGTRGLGSHTAAAVGSVAQSAVENALVPVMLVK